MNPTGGWAESGRALGVGIERVREAGGDVRAGQEVVGLVKDGRNVMGVKLRDGEEVMGDLIVVSLTIDRGMILKADSIDYGRSLVRNRSIPSYEFKLTL